MIYYVSTNLDSTIDDVSKSFKQGYVSVDVPQLWEDSFLKNFDKYWVDSANVLHKPENLSVVDETSPSDKRKQFMGMLGSLDDDIRKVKASTASDSSAFSNALNSKADLSVVNSLRDKLTSIGSEAASLPPSTSGSSELNSKYNQVQVNLNPLISSVARVNSLLANKADVSSLNAVSSKANFYQATNSTNLDNITKSFSGAIDGKANKSSLNSTSTSLSNRIDTKLDKEALRNFTINYNASQTANRQATSAVASAVSNKANNAYVVTAIDSLNAVLNSKVDFYTFKKEDEAVIKEFERQMTYKVDKSTLKYLLAGKYFDLTPDMQASLASKVVGSSLTSINDSLSSLAQNANGNTQKTYVDSVANSLSGLITSNGTLSSISENIKSKADNDSLVAIEKNLQDQIIALNTAEDGNTKNRDALQQQVNSKANQDSLNAIADELSTKASKADLDVLKKANDSMVNVYDLQVSLAQLETRENAANVRKGILENIMSSFASKADKATVNKLSEDLGSFKQQLDGKVSPSDFNIQLASKADDIKVNSVANSLGEKINQTKESLNNKADYSAITTLHGTIQTTQDMIAGVRTEVDKKANNDNLSNLKDELSRKAEKESTQSAINSLDNVVGSLARNPVFPTNLSDSLAMINANLNLTGETTFKNSKVIDSLSKAVSSLSSNTATSATAANSANGGSKELDDLKKKVDTIGQLTENNLGLITGKVDQIPFNRLSEAVNKKLEAKDVQSMFTSYAANSTSSATANPDAINSLSNGLSSVSKEIKDAANVIISIGDFNNEIRGRVENLESSSGSGKTNNTDLSNYSTKNDLENKYNQMIAYVQDQMQKLTNMVKPAMDLYNSSVAASQAAAAEAQRIANLTNAAKAVNAYPYTGKSFMLIDGDIKTNDKSVVSDTSTLGTVYVDSLDTSKNQTVTITYSPIGHTFGTTMYENGGETLPKLTFNAKDLASGQKVQWYKDSYITSSGNQLLTFNDMFGNKSTRYTKGNWGGNYAVIKNITVTNN